MPHSYDVIHSSQMTEHSHSYNQEVMTHTLYESQYDSLPRDVWVYYAEGFHVFSYDLFYISVENSSLDGELDSNKNCRVRVVNLCTYSTLDHFQTF